MGEYVVAQDVRDAAYGLTIPEDAVTTVALERLVVKAESRLLARVPSIPSRVQSGVLDVELVRGVVEDIVLRVVRNPRGLSYEQAGEFAYRIDQATTTGAIEVLDADIASLLPRRLSAVGSIRLGVPDWRLP